ncbi:MAG: hypothetical protein ACI9FZ_000430 [Bacteroidia bacterium]|jgi:hypothetical protein
MLTKTKICALTGLAALGLSYLPTLNAEENLWIYTKGTDTRPQGSWEAKLSSISRLDKGSGDYAFHDVRPEIEYGITDKLTVGVEFMIFNHDYSVNDPELEPMYSTQGGDRNKSFRDTKIGGYEISLKYNILSPYKDAIGLSVGFAFEHRDQYRLDGADIDQDSFVPMIFLQKNFIDDRLTWALNGKVEFERRKSPGVLEEEIALDISTGIAYRVAPKWFIGWEIRYQGDFLAPQVEADAGADGFDSKGISQDLKPSSFDLSDISLGSNHQYAIYTGPSVHYAEESWWATVGLLAQVWGDGSKFAYVKQDKNYDEHEKIHLGLSVGYEF